MKKETSFSSLLIKNLVTPLIFHRDSDDEAEGKVPAAAKKPLAAIVNEVEAMDEEAVPEVSGENKAAAELMKIGMARNTEDSTLLMEESDETRMTQTQ